MTRLRIPALSAVALSLIVSLALPAGASADLFVARLNDSIFLQDFSEDTNNLTYGLSGGNHTLTDTGAVIDTDFNFNGDRTDDDCAPVPADSPVATNSATCPALPDDVLTIFLEGGDDAAGPDGTVPTPVTICGGTGDDELTGAANIDFLLGEDGSDTIVGGEGDDSLLSENNCAGNAPGAPGDDNLDGGPGADAHFGGAGKDTFSGGPGGDIFFGEAEDDQIAGGDGADTLVGHAGSDTLDAGTGDDFLNGGDGNDSLLGGEGADVLGIIINQAAPTATRVSREDGNDLFEAGPGDDTLNAGPGDTVFNFGSGFQIGASETTVPNGADDFRGGPGRDTLTYFGFAQGVRITPDGLADDGAPGEGDNVRDDNEVLEGGSATDTLLGGPGPESIDGGLGDDHVSGGGGADTLAGGAEDGGADRLNGAEGDDSVRGGPGNDTLAGDGGLDTLDGGAGTDGLNGGAEADDLAGGSGADALEGGSGDDRLRGASDSLAGADGPDSLSGGDGRDALDGGPGDDLLKGGRDTDTVAGAAGSDIAVYEDQGLPVTATLDGAPNDGVPGENDLLGSDVEGLLGGAEQDSFIGNAAANILDGGAGEDFLDGGTGSDELSGREGIDLIRSRDRRADTVNCGPRRDLSITDADDRLRGDCELDNPSNRPAPRARKEVVVSRVQGLLGLRLPGGRRFFAFSERLQVPFGSAVDASLGRVRVTMATREGKKRAGEFSDGRFAVRKKGGRTVLALQGGDPSSCGDDAKTVTRRLSGRLRAGFRVRGRRSVTSASRATVVVEDRCDGTLTRVLRGRAAVRDLGSKRQVSLEPGRRYLAVGR